MKYRHLVPAALLVLSLPTAARAQTVLFSESFDSGLSQWTATGLWHAEAENTNCSTQIAPFPSPGTCAAFNNGNNPPASCGFFTANAGTLTTALPISIPAAATNARLRFVSFEETECGGSGNCGWDHRFVKISSDGGANWTDVLLGEREGAWYERYASLDAYIGQDVLVRFEFDPVDTLWNFFRGWLVDDVIVEIDLPATTYCTGKVSSQGCIPSVTMTGDVSLSGADDIYVTADLLVNNVASKLIWSRGSNATPFHGGTLCVAVPAARTSVTSSGGTAGGASDCTGGYVWHFSHAYLATKSVMAGETLYVQASTRDPGFNPPNNHSLSNALSFTMTP